MPHLSNITQQRQQLRQQMRAARQALTPQQQQLAAQRIIPPALKLIEYYQAQHIALYLPFQGEISPLALLHELHKRSKKCYLPRLHPFSSQQLLFLAHQPNAPFHLNRFGITEPILDVRKVIPLAQLDLIFVPLVACDHQGNRLGMGGGFYDRTLSQTPNTVRVGLAHQLQLCQQLPTASWDQKLDHLIFG